MIFWNSCNRWHIMWTIVLRLATHAIYDNYVTWVFSNVANDIHACSYIVMHIVTKSQIQFSIIQTYINFSLDSRPIVKNFNSILYLAVLAGNDFPACFSWVWNASSKPPFFRENCPFFTKSRHTKMTLNKKKKSNHVFPILSQLLNSSNNRGGVVLRRPPPVSSKIYTLCILTCCIAALRVTLFY